MYYLKRAETEIVLPNWRINFASSRDCQNLLLYQAITKWEWEQGVVLCILGKVASARYIRPIVGP